MNQRGASSLLARPASFAVIQGERRIADREDVVLTTLLGSCVAACIWDSPQQVGGMNHFLLPDRGAHSVSCGVHAMELLINDLLKLGASRSRMQAKLFGGAWIRHGLTDIGDQNASFAERFLADEGIALVGSSMRGDRGRRVQFWPMTGRARLSFMDRNDPVPVSPPITRECGELEMF